MQPSPDGATAGSDPMWCVIPAAGKGTRLGSRGTGSSKTLLQVGGRLLIQLLLDRLSPAITDACLVVAEGDGSVRDALGHSHDGMRIHYVEQPQPLGVADAVFKARSLITGAFAVVMGDTYYERSLAPYLDVWRRSGAGGAVLVERIAYRPLDRIGLVQVQGNRVTEVSKVPFRAQAQHRVCGMMVLPRAALEAEGEIAPGPAGELELEEVVTWLMARGTDFLAIPYRGWRRNVNTPEDLEQVEKHVESAGAVRPRQRRKA